MRPAIFDTVSSSAVASGIPILRMGRALEDVICGSSSASSASASAGKEEKQDQLPRLAQFFAQEKYILNARVRTRLFGFFK